MSLILLLAMTGGAEAFFWPEHHRPPMAEKNASDPRIVQVRTITFVFAYVDLHIRT